MNYKEYERALERIGDLMQRSPAKGSPERVELSRLVDKVKEYEDKAFPGNPSDWMSATTRWSYFRYITLSKILWYVTGRFIWDAMYDYWWVRIAKRPARWPDADQKSCQKRWCRYCGKGSKL